MRYKSANDSRQKVIRKSLRNNATPAEAILWRALKGRGTGGYKFRRQQGIGQFILDFFCPELLICDEKYGNTQDFKSYYDEQRTHFLNSQGITVIRFSNDQVCTNVDGVVSEIIRIAKELEAHNSK